MMKKILSILTVLCIALAALPLAAAETVTGTATEKGFGGDITVTVELTDGVITAVTIVGDSETPGIGGAAVEQLDDAMLAANSINVDGFSGATFSSDAILAAARAALENAGVNPDDYMGRAETGAAEDAVYEADIVIVGAGGAGMTAAIAAADAGRTVVLVESQALVGGNSVRATGGMNASKTPAQDENAFGETAGVEKTLANTTYAENAFITGLQETVAAQWKAYQANPEGYFDSVELMELDTMIGGYALNDPELVKALCENSAAAVEWLKSIDISLTSVGAFGGASVKRIHRPVNEKGQTVSVGAYMIPLLEAAVNARENITVLFETTAKEIILTDGAAAGIVAVGKTGNTVTVNAQAVVLATGGFGANLEMVAAYKPELEGFMTTNAAGAQGQGIAMAQAVGAAVVDLDQIQIHPTVQVDTASLITEGLRGDGAILVNAEGMRFIDEVGTRDVVSAAEIAQTGSYSWLLVDKKMYDASSVIQGYVKKGFMYEGESLEALAETIGIPAETLTATVEDWNAKVAAKVDPDFGRTSFANPLDTAPYYAVKVTAGIHHTMGGVKINANTQVLAADGTVIPGLYAAGEVTGGVHGANRLGGNAVADFTVFGRIAGLQAAEYVK